MTDGEAPSRRPLLVLCFAAIAGALALHLTGSSAFQPYFGRINPVLGMSAVAVLAISALSFLQSHGWFVVDRPASGLRRFSIPALLASLLAVPVIIVDLAGGFPRDINVLPPEGLLFYPVIALVAETVFHIAPLAVLLFVLPWFVGSSNREGLLVVCVLVAALSEPVFQVVAGLGDSPAWATAYVAFHLFVFSLLGLWLFYRHGFFSLLALRLVYYLWWHIVWGVLRLRLLN